RHAGMRCVTARRRKPSPAPPAAASILSRTIFPFCWLSGRLSKEPSRLVRGLEGPAGAAIGGAPELVGPALGMRGDFHAAVLRIIELELQAGDPRLRVFSTRRMRLLIGPLPGPARAAIIRAIEFRGKGADPNVGPADHDV